MSFPPSGQDVIAAFFAALTERADQWQEQCRRVVVELKARRWADPELRLWAVYLRGIFAFEVEHNWSKAERLFACLLAMDLPPNLRSRTLYALGRSYDIQGRWQQAIETFRAIEVISDPIDRAKAWKHIAITLCRSFSQGAADVQQLRLAVEYCERALNLLTSLPQPSPGVRWLIGSIWTELGAVNMNLGYLNQALICYQQGMASNKALKDRQGVGIGYLNLGEVYQQQDPATWPLALRAYRQALRRFRATRDPYLEADALANIAFLYQGMNQPTRALSYYRKSIALLEALRTKASTPDGRAGFFGTVVDTFVNAALVCWDTGDMAAAFGYVEGARSRAFLDMLAARSPTLSQQMDHRTITLAETQAALPEDALLLEFFTTGLLDPHAAASTSDSGTRRYRFPKPRILIFAISRNSIEVHETSISPNMLQTRQQEHIVEVTFRQPMARRRLYKELIAPVEHLLRDRRRLYIVPHGPLHYVPFAALIAGDDDMLLREDGPQLVYGFSATFLFHRRPSPMEQSTAACLALGYNGDGEDALTHAEQEAQRVTDLLGGDALISTDLTKEELYRRAPHYRILHVACHGDFDPFAPLDSALYLAPNEKLTALDVLKHMRLRCDLITLSACESGLSHVQRGDELVGLPRAFVYAGARSVIATQWRVKDHVAHLLMDRLYQELADGSDVAEALKCAQIDVKMGDPQDDDWAAFILMGDPNEP